MKTSPANWIWLDISYRPSFKNSRANEPASISPSLSLPPSLSLSLINHRLNCSRFALTKCRSFGFPSPFVLYMIFTLLFSLKLKHASLNITQSQHLFTVNSAAVPNVGLTPPWMASILVNGHSGAILNHLSCGTVSLRPNASTSIWLWPLSLYCIINSKWLREEETHLVLSLNPFIFRKPEQ